MQQAAKLACESGAEEGIDVGGRGMECIPTMHYRFVILLPFISWSSLLSGDTSSRFFVLIAKDSNIFAKDPTEIIQLLTVTIG